MTFSASENRVPALLWAPAYDEVTTIMAGWLEELKGKCDGFLSGDKVCRGDVHGIIKSKYPRLAIFCGHGSRDALLGPPSPPYVVSYDGSAYSPIYDYAMVSTGPTALFAFCCDAGTELGQIFASFEGRVFLGYTTKLRVIVRDPSCEDVWKEIVQGISRRIIEDGGIARVHEDMLRKAYEQAYLSFKEGPLRNNEYAKFMRLYLSSHAKSLCCYGPTPP